MASRVGKNTQTTVLTALHLLVDGLCACGLMMLANKMAGEATLGLFVVYNLVAFGTQPLTGSWTDRTFPRTTPLSVAIPTLALGAVLCLLFDSGFTVFSPFLCALLLGVGNSLFHVYGGKNVTTTWQNDARPIGVFVSTGALGLTLGLCFSGVWMLTGFGLAIVVLGGFHLRSAKMQSDRWPTSEKQQDRLTIPAVCLLCLMFVVAGRSFLGRAVPSLDVSSPVLQILVSAVAMMGKATGGFLSSARFGLRTTLIGSLMLVCGVFLLCPVHAAAIPVTIFLVNLSMPCTLCLANKAVPGREALAFGLLAAALLPGYWLGSVCLHDSVARLLLTPLLATILIESLILLYMRERRWKVLTASVLMNILTNVPLNILVLLSPVSWTGVIGLECLVFLIEFLLYRSLRLDRRTALTYSAVCNATSYLAGLIFQLIL